jgi:hypothetical protein
MHAFADWFWFGIQAVLEVRSRCVAMYLSPPGLRVSSGFIGTESRLVSQEVQAQALGLVWEMTRYIYNT